MILEETATHVLVQLTDGSDMWLTREEYKAVEKKPEAEWPDLLCKRRYGRSLD